MVFAAVKSVLIEPLPFARPEELVQLRSEFPKMQRSGRRVSWGVRCRVRVQSRVVVDRSCNGHNDRGNLVPDTGKASYPDASDLRAAGGMRKSRRVERVPNAAS